MKKIVTVFLALVISCMFFLPVNAAIDEDLPRVVDNAGIFTEDEFEELEERVTRLCDKYDISYVLLTDNDNHDMSLQQYAADFITENGYDDEDGAVIFYLSLEYGNRGWRTTSIDKYEDIFDEKATNAIDDIVNDDIENGDYYEAFLKHIDFVEEIYKNGGKLPLKYRIQWDNVWIALIVAAVVGAVVGGMRLSSCRKAMRVVAPVDAHEYLVRDSFNLRDKKTYYLYSTVTRTRKQKSSGSSGGSTFSGGSSGGRSYSSGGRNF